MMPQLTHSLGKGGGGRTFASPPRYVAGNERVFAMFVAIFLNKE
jgi:hypothetical protein